MTAIRGTRAARPPSERVGIVMLTWNALAYTKRALASLRTATTYPDLDVVVVDNGSTDGTVEWLRTVPGIHVIANGRNLGFTGGVNVGLAALDDDCDAVLLNNDLLITQGDWIQRLRDCAYSAPDIGIVGCRLVDAEGRLQHAGSYVTPVAMRGEQIGGELDVGQYVTRREVECAVGAALYVKRALLDLTGGLHREYFSYFEDTDLCYEAAQEGLRTMYAGDVTLVHHQNVSTRENRADMWEMFERSHGLFVRRWGERIRRRYSPTVEIRAPFECAGHNADGEAAVDLTLALHEAGVAVVPRLSDGAMAEFDHPLLADISTRDVPPGTVCLAVGPGATVPAGRPAVRVAGSSRPTDLGGCAAVWVASEYAAEQQRPSAAVPIEVVPWGIDPDYFHPGARRFRSRGGFVAGTVLDWDDEWFRTTALLAAFNAAFRCSDPVVFHCHVRSAPDGADPAAAARAVPLDPEGGRIVVTSGAPVARAERCALYASWDACVVAELDPHSPVGVLAPMAVGVPTVAIAAGAAAGLLDDACAWLVPDDPGEMAAAVTEIVSDPTSAARRAARGAAKASGHTWAATAATVRDLLEKLV